MKQLEELRKFLLESTQAGYGNPDVRIEKADDGTHAISYENGKWRMLDTFYGGHPYSGQEVIFFDDRAIWALQYRGWVYKTELSPSEVYDFLKKALLAAPKEHPFRGPKSFSSDKLTYCNSWQGELDNFSGEEIISDSRQKIYKGLYLGGVVDQ